MDVGTSVARWFSGNASLSPVIARYGAPASASPVYVVVGVLRTSRGGMVGGVLAFATNEVHAHLLKRAFAEFALPEYGVGVLRTVHHPQGATFDVDDWRARVAALPHHCRDGADVACLA